MRYETTVHGTGIYIDQIVGNTKTTHIHIDTQRGTANYRGQTINLDHLLAAARAVEAYTQDQDVTR